MESYVINLDRSADRLAQFRANNGFLANLQRFAAVDGGALDRAQLVSQGLIDAQLRYSDGNLGCALSHRRLWEYALRNDTALTVFEDDAILNRHFARRSAALLDGLPGDWDFVLWGWNFDTVLVVDFLPGISHAIVNCNQDSLRGQLNAYRERDFEVVAHPLVCAFGTLAYSLSPLGARKLLEASRPLRPFNLLFGGPSCTVAHTSIDIMLIAQYPKMRSFACFPPLAVTPNVRDG